MRILAFSDLHLDEAAATALVEAGAEADLVLGLGDFASAHRGLPEVMARLAPLADRAVYVCGNNETEAALRAATEATVLQGEAVTRGGLTIAGIGCAVPPLPPIPWPSNDLTEEEAAELLDRIPAVPRVDILLSHSPPRGACDRHSAIGPMGSEAVRAAAVRLAPRLLLCGHVHDAWGARDRIGETQVCNLGPGVTWFDLEGQDP